MNDKTFLEIKLADKPNRIYSLDLLKFFLTIIIVFHHFQQGTGAIFKGVNFYNGRIYFGYCVEAFFLISGFVTAFQVSAKGTGNFKTWMEKRILRILPISALSVVAWLVVYLFYKLFTGSSFPGLWRIFTSVTCTFVGGGVILPGDGQGVNNPLWYVCVLFICYAIYYCLQYLSKKQR